jgi:exopolyphosphatase/guanosine-5'-triphosphate,3'-diphosphate pyrophosphatase
MRLAERFRDDPSLARARTAGDIETPDLPHSQHVAYLSLRLYDQLRELLQLPSEGRDLLAAAALWHDCGQFRSLPDHHRQSLRRILALPLNGFSREEQAVIANIARYHRAAPPSIEHPEYRRLAPAQRRVVDQMAAILRIAEGLDAGHLQLVEDAVVEQQRGYVVIWVYAPTFPSLEIERAQARAGLFRDVFGQDIDVRLALPEAKGAQSTCAH